MKERNLKGELGYHSYADMEHGGDVERIDYESLIGLLDEVLARLDKLEGRVTIGKAPALSTEGAIGAL